MKQKKKHNSIYSNDGGFVYQRFRHQVSWGKHSPSSYRGKNKAAAGGRADFSLFFPIVILKDPFTWMQSFCRDRKSTRLNSSHP